MNLLRVRLNRSQFIKCLLTIIDHAIFIIILQLIFELSPIVFIMELTHLGLKASNVLSLDMILVIKLEVSESTLTLWRRT